MAKPSETMFNASAPWPVRRIDVGGTDLAVAEFGSGPPLVLLHGIGSRGVSWIPVIETLSQRSRLIVPDLRGHGSSGKPGRGYLLDDFADDLDNLIASWNLEGVGIIGHSLGGMVALEWARRTAKPARFIVLEDVPLRRAADPDVRFSEWIALASMSHPEATSHFRQRYPDWSDDDCRRRAESITGTDVAVFIELRDFFRGEPMGSRAERYVAVQTPTLLVYGDVESGGMVPAPDAQEFSRRVPGASVFHLPGGSHNLHRDQTQAFIDAVQGFLADQPA